MFSDAFNWVHDKTPPYDIVNYIVAIFKITKIYFFSTLFISHILPLIDEEEFVLVEIASSQSGPRRKSLKQGIKIIIHSRAICSPF